MCVALRTCAELCAHFPAHVRNFAHIFPHMCVTLRTCAELCAHFPAHVRNFAHIFPHMCVTLRTCAELCAHFPAHRSEERRVGKEGSTRWSPGQGRQKKEDE